ncbi:MAG: aminotransferase class I/II-fold pyridoxal phosphate-dependent enzyme [Alphaproteobacteria bacterium]|nr:aminotransferase class I/II-fold pyridoxal phosphate-dependent enzyme [Alphaproteobacteria bacterium]MBV9371455.1 aminotransferase class I/II-fold pyridoxal phosphate-dependent enzyme [Alphaproteobacteria bacterium]MBV9902392.1 aminotransferase class I/II-fold pyridoxal phosphate-dependent enzyme [Alphaproteobacteria bacterium]
MLNSSSSSPLDAGSLADLLGGCDGFDPCPDNAALRNYIEGGCREGPPIPLALGETWRGAPAGLVALLSEAPAYSDGYLLAPSGLPELQRAIVAWLSDEYRLPLASSPLRAGASPTGTRSLMHAFGAWLASECWRGERLHLTSFTPSWDYRGVFTPLGFVPNPIALSPRDGFAPDLRQIEAAIASVPRSARQLVVLNPQHNPTALNWPDDLLRSIVRLASEAGAALLIDDAYHGLTDSGTTPSSALNALLETCGAEPSLPFLLVRSLGKQFGCNGWSVGAYLGGEESVLGLQRQLAARSLNVGGRVQWALSRWIGSEAAAADIKARRDIQSSARRAATDMLPALGLGPEDVVAGDATPFLAFRVPPPFRGEPRPTASFLAAAAERGVSLSPLLPSASGLGMEQGDSWVRMYLGLGADAVAEAIERVEPILAQDRRRRHAG